MRFTAILLVLATLAGCLGCTTKDNESGSLKTITLNEVAHSIFYAPQYVAIESGYFEEEGLSINLVTGFGADKVMTSLVSGDADIGFMGSESSIYVYEGGSKDYAVNFAQLTQRAGNFLVSREEMKDFSWDDIRYCTIIGGRQGGMPQMLLEYILKKNGINPEKDLTIIKNVDFGSTAAAFASGLADFTVEFEPTATTLEQEGKGYVVASLGVESGYVPYTAYCAKVSYIEKHPEMPAKLHPHMFRRSRATDLYQNGVDLEVVSRFLGHSSIQTTRIYANPSVEQMREAVEKIANKDIEVPVKQNWSSKNEDEIAKLCGLR